MLENVVLDQKVDRQEYDQRMEVLERRLGELQREARALRIPIAVVFEGWDAAGKGTLINRLMQSLDPRGFSVHPISAPTEEEKLRPFLWRFWRRIPEKGRIAIFDRSWYRRVLTERVDKLIRKREWSMAYEQIRSFERQLTEDGCVLIKLFLHISKKEQKKRFRKLEATPALAWKVTEQDWQRHQQYDEYWQATEEALAQTDTAYAPWTIVESQERRFATLKTFVTVVRALEEAVSARNGPAASNETSRSEIPELREASILDLVDLSLKTSRRDYEQKLGRYQKRLRELEHAIYIRRIPVVVVFEGWDAAGKGGNIKRLTRLLDPRGYEVIPIGAPNDVEKNHHYLWRFWNGVPKAGHMTVFDRSWYGRVLVERVEELCTPEEWRRAYREINEFEENLVRFGTVLVKFWLHIDQQEQAKRFKEREETPWKQWKITEEDWRNREKWCNYQAAVEEMLARTSTSHAPWTIVESNQKLYARLKTLKTLVDVIEPKL